METRAAVINNGVVTNIIVIDAGKADAIGAVELPADSQVAIGWTYANAQFSAPIPKPLAPEENIAAIKAKAGQLITSRLPEYKQRNYLARKAELQDILIAGGVLSASEQAEVDFLAAEWAWAKAVRVASNEAEAAGTPVDAIVWPS